MSQQCWFFKISGKGHPDPPADLAASLNRCVAAAYVATHEGFQLFTLEQKGADLAGSLPGIGSGWQQSKQDWGLPAVMGEHV